MKRLSLIIMAVALVLGMAQCKKDQPQTDDKTVKITLSVDGGDNDGSRAYVTPPSVAFENQDKILVVSGGVYLGTLTHNGLNFTGTITNPREDEKLYFYYLGNIEDGSTFTPGLTASCVVNISDQSNYPHLPVISMGESTQPYSSGTSNYSSRLRNYASLMKFNVTSPYTSVICITGMNNQVTVRFNDPTESGFEYGKVGDGVIKMAGDGSGEMWAIVLPQDELSVTGVAYTEDLAYSGIRPAIHAIEANKWYHEGDDVVNLNVNNINNSGPICQPFTIQAVYGGASVVLEFGQYVSRVLYCKNDGDWYNYTSEQTINLDNAGDKVMFLGENSNFNNSRFYVTGDCYVSGNIMSLISERFDRETTVHDNAFVELFAYNTSIKNHPSEALVLPATTLGVGCYAGMFYGCTGLTVAPVLSASELPFACYFEMFKGCSNLKSVKCLATNNSAEHCTSDWLDGVASTGTFTKAAGVNWSTGASDIPAGWTVIEQ